MAKSLRSKRKRKFRALKRIKHKPKIDAKMKEIALEVDAADKTVNENDVNQENMNATEESKLDNKRSTVEETEEDEDNDIDMDNKGSDNPKKSSKSSSIPFHLLSQRKLRKLQMKHKQKKGNPKKKNFLKW